MSTIQAIKAFLFFNIDKYKSSDTVLLITKKNGDVN